MTTKQKIANFWDYHKVHVIVSVIALIFIIMTFVECSKNKNPDISIGYVSTEFRDHLKLEEELEAALGDANGDGNSYVFCDNVVINKVPQTDQDSMMIQKVTVMFVSGEYRLYIMDKNFFETDVYGDMFMDLRGIVPSETLEGACELFDTPIAIKTQHCKFLKDIDFSGENLYVGLTAVGDPDKGNKNIDRDVEIAKKVLKILIEGK